MSKRSEPTSRRRPSKIVFYLDRNLCAKDILEPLRLAGYDLVAYSDEFGRVYDQAVPDPEIIAMCGRRRHILITGDRKLEYTYAPEIYKAGIGIVLLGSNNDGSQSWKRRLIVAQAAIREQIKKRRKPYLMRVSLDGSLTTIRLYRKAGSKSIQLS